MYRIFIIEDDEIIARAVKQHLERWDYIVSGVSDFSNIMAEFAMFAPQLVLMDVKLPFYNGYYWCSEIRKVSKVPIIFISSASENMNIVMAVNMGGDDFIAKPFELNKRQRAIVDYDPESPSVKIHYFTENEKETAELQGSSSAEKEILAFKNGRPCFIKD